KYPRDLSDALERRTPSLLGFSNYSWNCHLSYEYVTRVKRRHPQTVFVFGGPNYGLAPEEQAAFWARFPLVDFYVLREGALALVELIRSLDGADFDAGALKRAGTVIPSTHYAHEGRIVSGPLLERIGNLNDIPSPYLRGMMDKFFDNVLIPMTYTTRGCPF